MHRFAGVCAMHGYSLQMRCANQASSALPDNPTLHLLAKIKPLLASKHQDSHNAETEASE